MIDNFGSDTLDWINKKISIKTQYVKDLKKYEIVIAGMK